MSARTYDTNGWFEVKDNPISKVGVFPYKGSSIGADEPDRIYMVYRPAEELSDPEALASFRLLPWIDDHEMLGESFAEALRKGVGGVIGENVWFDPTTGDGVVRANLKCFSEVQAARINAGKDELSAGYRCVYDFTPGVFNGIAYDAVQRCIRGNHLASVDMGRMGPSVAVLDHMTFTTDGMEFIPVSKKPRALTAEDLARINANPALAAATIAAMDAAEDEGEKGSEDEDDKTGEDEDDKTPPADKTGEDEDDKTPPAADADDDKTGEDEDDKTGEDEDDKTPPAADGKLGMDAAEADFVTRVAARDKQAKALRPVIGAFDHSGMTRQQVAEYGVRKLGLKGVPKGSEVVAVDAYLAGHSRNASTANKAGTGMDAADKPKRPGFIGRRFDGK